jgi:hypothetical protein
MCENGTCGMDLYDYAGFEAKQGIGPPGKYRLIVIDPEGPAILEDRRFTGIIPAPQSLPEGQVEVIWTEGGGLRIVTNNPSEAAQKWQWSHSGKSWAQGGCPPDEIIQAIKSALGLA